LHLQKHHSPQDEDSKQIAVTNLLNLIYLESASILQFNNAFNNLRRQLSYTGVVWSKGRIIDQYIRALRTNVHPSLMPYLAVQETRRLHETQDNKPDTTLVLSAIQVELQRREELRALGTARAAQV
jgi:hypothetical protein